VCQHKKSMEADEIFDVDFGSESNCPSFVRAIRFILLLRYIISSIDRSIVRPLYEAVAQSIIDRRRNDRSIKRRLLENHFDSCRFLNECGIVSK
jgi:hypothetical protein